MSTYTPAHRGADQPRARYAEPAQRQRRKRWSRRRKIVTTVIVLIIATALVAVAAALLRAPILGSLNVPAVDANLKFAQLSSSGGGTDTVVIDKTAATCDATLNGAGDLTINLVGQPGQGCTIIAAVTSLPGANRQPRVQAVDWTGQTTESFVAASHATSGAVAVACGATVPVEPAFLKVAFRVIVAPGTGPGDHPALANAGVTAVPPNDYVAANCPKI